MEKISDEIVKGLLAIWKVASADDRLAHALRTSEGYFDEVEAAVKWLRAERDARGLR